MSRALSVVSLLLSNGNQADNTALLSTFSSIGNAFGLCFATLISTEVQRGLSGMSEYEMLMKGLRSSFWGCAGCAWGGMFGSIWVTRLTSKRA
jgi:hypothetical protein